MQYELNINIDSQGVEQINQAGQQVTISKSDPTTNPIAWIGFAPLESNILTWTDNYYMYASTSEIENGVTIDMSSQTPDPLQLGFTYTLQDGAFLSTSGTGSSYIGENQEGDSLTFGLAQSSTVNGNSQTLTPLNAVTVLNNETANFTPLETVYVCLYANTANGTVISSIASSALKVVLSSTTPSANIGFNDTNNTFYLK